MTDTELKLADILALERTRLAAERSLMAWVRTALSMISFGFTIYKFMQASSGTKRGSRSAAAGTAQHRTYARRHRNLCSHHRLCSTLEIHKKVETRSTLQALGPGVHRGMPYWVAWPPGLREHDSQDRPLRVKTVISNRLSVRPVAGSCDGRVQIVKVNKTNKRRR